MKKNQQEKYIADKYQQSLLYKLLKLTKILAHMFVILLVNMTESKNGSPKRAAIW